VEQAGGADPEATEALVLRVAKTLQGSFAKQTTGGVARKWREVPPDEKKLWLRLARMAERSFNEPGSPPAVPAATPAPAPVARGQSKIAEPAPKPAPSAPARSTEVTAAARHPAPAPEAAPKPAAPKKASANSAMLRLLGVKPRTDVQK
jgi:hypothetical protein